MGRALVHAAEPSCGVSIVGAVSSADSACVGQDVGELAGAKARGVLVTADLAAACLPADVVIDFSTAQAARTNLAICRQRRKALLIGTTGLPETLAGAFAEAAREIPLLIAPNTSLAITLLIELVRTAARALPDFDIEIIEAHHRGKRDAPSGTALALAKAATAARGPRPERSASDPSPLRRAGEIGFAVVRAGDLVGEHTVLLAGAGERVSLGHQATDRGIFARGALRAAAWLALQPPGPYVMGDIIRAESIT